MKIVLIGASLETTNLGVSALGFSIISGLVKRINNLELFVFDYGKDERNRVLNIDGIDFTFKTYGCTYSKNIFRIDSIRNYYLNAFFRTKINPGLEVLKGCDCVLDITGGDSFTDLYGKNRFMASYLRKMLVLKLKKPLILLPQTYGPFLRQRTKKKTKKILEGAQSIWTRDIQSKKIIDHLYNNKCNININLGMDVAFLLPREEPKESHDFFSYICDNSILKIGINVSGLLFQKENQCKSFGINIDYSQLMLDFTNWLTSNNNIHVFLIPHVLGNPEDSREMNSDIRACINLKKMAKNPKKIEIIERDFNQCEIKWFISKMDWFCGARMHAAIAALSSMVPTAVQAYSDKALGVFNLCGQENNVIDLRIDSYEEILNSMKNSFSLRTETKKILYNEIPKLLSRAEKQMDELVAIIKENENE